MSSKIIQFPIVGSVLHPTYCPGCGEAQVECKSLPVNLNLYECKNSDCGKIVMRSDIVRCEACKSPMAFIRSVAKDAPVPASKLCVACEERKTVALKMVADGGVWFICVVCGSTGVLYATDPTAIMAREKSSAHKGVEPVIKFNGCPICNAAQPATPVEESGGEDEPK